MLQWVSSMENGSVDVALLTSLGPFSRRSSCKDVDNTGSAPFASIRHDGSTCAKVMNEAYLVILVLE